jgi:glycosyltransferase involved in cell wall biosynthesis
MRNKSICLISRSIYPHPIGLHTQNMQTFEGWLRFLEKVVIIAQTESKVKETSSYNSISGVLLPLILNKYFNIVYFTIFGIFEINKLNKKYSFEVFQASDAGGAFLALLASKFYKKKFIFEIQGDIFDYPNENGKILHSILVKFFSKFLAKKADYIRIVSPFLYDNLDKLNINRNKIFLVTPRCDTNLFNYKNIKADQPKQFINGKYNLLFVGNLIYAKGVDILLEAFALIEKEYPNVTLSYIGDGKEKYKLSKRAKDLGIDKKIIFFNRVDYKDIPIMMFYSDILVLPSREEGVGRVILEAMAMKLPVVASNVGGIPLIIENYKNGLLFESENAESLTRQIILLINDKKLAISIKNSAYQKFISNYEYEVSMKQFINMYKKIL